MRLHGLTAPVDPRPYAGPTDLRTAEDVARWLRERADRDLRANCHPSAFVLHYAHADLRARLDRERRQACRRGALAEWQEFRRWVHGWGYGWGDGDGIALDVLSRALAFRAAARAR